MERHAANAAAVAAHLERHPKVERVIYPGLERTRSTPSPRQQMRGFGGMISIYLKGDLEAARRFLEGGARCSPWPRASAASRA